SSIEPVARLQPPPKRAIWPHRLTLEQLQGLLRIDAHRGACPTGRRVDGYGSVLRTVRPAATAGAARKPVSRVRRRGRRTPPAAHRPAPDGPPARGRG